MRARTGGVAPPTGLGRVTPGRLAVAAALVAVLAVICRRVGDPDFYWHLATGAWILDHGRLLSHDAFTYTVAGRPWVDQEYGNEILLTLLYRAGGFLAVSLAYTALTWVGFWLIWRRIALERVAGPIAALCLLLAAGAGIAVWGPRSQMITFTLTCLTLLWVERFLRGQGRRLYLLPAVFAVWTNLHGGFIYGLLVLGVAALSESLLVALATGDRAAHRARALRLWIVLLGCGVAALLNAHTYQTYLVALRIELSSVQQSFIAEWRSPNFHSPEELLLELLLVCTIAAMAMRRPRLWDLLLSMTAIWLALAAVRNAYIAAALVTPVVAWAGGAVWEASGLRAHAMTWLRRRAADVTAVALVGALALAAAGVGFAATTLGGQAASTVANFPVRAVDCLEANPAVGTRMLNAYDWGGYLIYRFATPPADVPPPRRRVFIYGEATLMGNALMREISDVENGEPDWRSILRRNRVDYVIERPQSVLAAALSVDPAWREVYDDGFAAIFVSRAELARHPWNASAAVCRAHLPAPASS